MAKHTEATSKNGVVGSIGSATPTAPIMTQIKPDIINMYFKESPLFVFADFAVLYMIIFISNAKC